MTDKAKAPAAKKPTTRLVVREAFAHEGVYYTTHNIADAPDALLKAKLKAGKVVEEPIAADAVVTETDE